jgi:hypothetical protein
MHRKHRAALVVALLVAAGTLAIGTPATAVTATPYETNLVKNSGAEKGTAGDGYQLYPIPGWHKAEPAFTVANYGAPGLPNMEEAQRIGGSRHFFTCGDGVAANDLWQRIPITGRNAAIDSGHVRATFSVRIATYVNSPDHGSATLTFETGGSPSVLFDSLYTGELTGTQTRFVMLSNSLVVPAGTRQMYVYLDGARVSGNYCDAYFDNVKVELHHI